MHDPPRKSKTLQTPTSSHEIDIDQIMLIAASSLSVRVLRCIIPEMVPTVLPLAKAGFVEIVPNAQKPNKTLFRCRATLNFFRVGFEHDLLHLGQHALLDHRFECVPFRIFDIDLQDVDDFVLVFEPLQNRRHLHDLPTVRPDRVVLAQTDFIEPDFRRSLIFFGLRCH